MKSTLGLALLAVFLCSVTASGQVPAAFPDPVVPKNPVTSQENTTKYAIDPNTVGGTEPARPVVATRPPGTYDISLEDGTRIRKQFDGLDLAEFKKKGTRVYELAHEISVAAGESLDETSQQVIRTKASAIEKDLGRLIGLLASQTPKSIKSERPRNRLPLQEAIQRLAFNLNTLRPNLVILEKRQKTTFDLNLTLSVIQQLDAAQNAARQVARK